MSVSWDKFIFSFLLVIGILVVSSPGALALDKKGIQENLASLDERLTKIEKSQEEILEGQKEIIEKLAQLKIWVRRN